jgi:hypothetical protein
MACQLKLAGNRSGVPGGKPNDGSAVEAPALMIPTPKAPTTIGPQVPARLPRSAPCKPTAQANV